jgi:hypothetical protein
VVTVIGKRRGGSHSRLVLCDDGNLYVLKMHPNPQGPNVLANEALGSYLMRGLGFAVPDWHPITINLKTLSLFDELAMEWTNGRVYPAIGVHFGSRYVGARDGAPMDYLPESYRHKIVNAEQFAGVNLFDYWADHRDGRQCVYRRVRGTGGYEAFFIDNGHLFGGPRWSSTKALQLPARLREREHVEAWLSLLEQRSPTLLAEAVRQIPTDWYTGEIETLRDHYVRRLAVLRETNLRTTKRG